jgi:hypothetical protein
MKRRNWAWIIVAAAIALIGVDAQEVEAQNFSCLGGIGSGCCLCDKDWAGWYWCYGYALVGAAECQASFTECETIGLCGFFGSANSDAVAPDGSIYATVAGPEIDPRIVSRTLWGHEAQWEVVCGGVIADRAYSAEALAELKKRMAIITL